MKRITKKALRLVASAMSVVMVASFMAGCKKEVNDKDENGRTIVSVGAWPQKGTGKEIIEARKEKFEKDNPDIAIVPDAWSFDLKSFYAKAAGGQLPTIYQTNFTEASSIISAGYSADITEALKKRGYDNKFNQDVLDVVSKDGKIYAFPYYGYILGLGYNVDMFEKAGLMNSDGTPKQPKDWDEVREFAVKIKEATGKPGIVFPTSSNNGGWMFTPLAWSYGVEFMKQDSKGKWKATFDSEECVAALQYIKDLKWKYDVLPSNTLIDNTEYYKTFGIENAGMLIAPGNYGTNLTQYGMDVNKIGLMAIPAGPKKQVTLIGGGIYAINPKATDAQIDAALKWIETKYTYNVTDDFKTAQEKDIKRALDENRIIGIKPFSVWDKETDSVKYERDLIDKNANINMNHVKLYNDFAADLGNCEIQPEEPVCAQELYGVLDGCIQAVLTDENANCATIIKKACIDFQQNYLDNLDY